MIDRLFRSLVAALVSLAGVICVETSAVAESYAAVAQNDAGRPAPVEKAAGKKVKSAAKPERQAELTTEVVEKFRPSVVQIRILENDSQTKASIGSGFFVSEQGHIVTNYHVVSQLIHFPNSYSAEFVPESGKPERLTLIDVDVVHDLALVKADKPGPVLLSPAAHSHAQGERVFSMGNPFDLGFTIVEGTYNGLIEESLYEKIHFTGAINPGMSGGPAITASGKLVGVNVSTSGNEIGFLVPGKYVQALTERSAQKLDAPTNAELISRITEQLLANQKSYMEGLVKGDMKNVTLGRFTVPGQLSPALKCWSKSHEEVEQPFTVLSYACSTQDEIFLSDQHDTGTISFYHYLVTSETLNPFQFFSLYQYYFESDGANLSGVERDLTNFRCTNGFVESGGITFKSGFCLRGYKQMRGLYDVVFKAASLSGNRIGLQTTLVMSGVSFSNAQSFADKYLRSFSWK